MRHFGKQLISILGFIGAFGLFGSASADSRTDLAHLHSGQRAAPPIGWTQFCGENPGECRAVQVEPKRVALNETNWRELVNINQRFNRSIVAMTDQAQYGLMEYWTYAKTGKGDCEDYVLEKRRELARRGWPLSALLITVVLDKEGGGHAVLTVVTDRGEFVLDNQVDLILPWSKSELTFIKRQSPSDPNTWVELGRTLGRPDIVTAGIR
ncbi:MAG: transglutaminase-like cysteine peptidase [Proteobacteria bacterium]|nr:transglutaminase-like cysteine peptidase [Pseudomonadota bacterium]